MKDYTLSEIVAHCKEMGCDCNFCREYDSQTEEQKAIDRACRLFGMFTAERVEKLIEPRDMIELPCKTPANAEQWQISPYKWQVIWRGSYKICTCEFHTEEEADAFLAQPKGEKA